MSFGSLSANAKEALGRAATAVGTSTTTGDGGMTQEERAASKTLVYQALPSRYGFNPADLKAADAVEVVIGQGAKPGGGGMLLGTKVSERVAAMRTLPPGIDQRSASRHPDWVGPDDLRIKIEELREATSWEKPIYVKLGATRVENDVKLAVAAGADAVVVDGLQGGTAATQDVYIENAGIPTLPAVRIAAEALRDVGKEREVQLIVSGGIRSGSDVAKALALGADAVSIGTAALIAMGCNSPTYEIDGKTHDVTDEYRAMGAEPGYCHHMHTGLCPVGITTQDPDLEARLDPKVAARKVENYLRSLTMELTTLARACGKSDVHNMESADLVALTVEAAAMAQGASGRHGLDPRVEGLSAKPARYSALALLRRRRRWPPAWPDQDLVGSYDVVVVGGGVHGLATAYYLARNHGISRVAVLEKSYIGSGGSGRNTAIVRSNYLTPEGARFYDRSVKLYERLSVDLNFNVMFEQRGHMTLAHNDSSLRTMHWRAEVNKHEGIDSSVIGPDEVARLAPFIDVTDHPRFPILGALWHPPGGIVRHDAVVWGYARAAASLGVHIHQDTEVTGIDVVSSGGDGSADHARVGLGARRDQLHRGVVVAYRGNGRGPPADRHPSSAGGGDRARTALSAPRRRVGQPPRVRQPDRPRRARVRGRRRPLRLVLDARIARLHRGSRRARFGADAGCVPPQGAAAMGGAVRHDPRLRTDHRADARRGILRGRGVGNLRIQGRAGSGRGDGRIGCHRQAPRADFTLRPRTVRARGADGREGSGCSWPLTSGGCVGGRSGRAADHLSLLRATQRIRVRLAWRAEAEARSVPDDSGGVARLPLRGAERTGLGGGALVAPSRVPGTSDRRATPDEQRGAGRASARRCRWLNPFRPCNACRRDAAS